MRFAPPCSPLVWVRVRVRVRVTVRVAVRVVKINELAYTCAAPARALLPLPLTAGALDTDAVKRLPKQVFVWRVQPRRWQGAGPQVPPPLPGAGNKVQGVSRDHRLSPQDLGARMARGGGRRGRGPWHDSSASGQVGHHDERPPAAKCDRRLARTAATSPRRSVFGSCTYFPHLARLFCFLSMIIASCFHFLGVTSFPPHIPRSFCSWCHHQPGWGARCGWLASDLASRTSYNRTTGTVAWHASRWP